MATQVQVKLDTAANPAVTVIPEKAEVDRGNQAIEWTPFANQTFTFVSLTFTTTPNPFSNVSVTADQITATDNNQGAGEYLYTLVVSSGGVQYSSAHSGIVLGGGNPTIKNN